jgi:hypothetical protein
VLMLKVNLKWPPLYMPKASTVDPSQREKGSNSSMSKLMRKGSGRERGQDGQEMTKGLVWTRWARRRD